LQSALADGPEDANIQVPLRKETAMTIRDIMTKDTRACRPDTNLAEASALMWEGNCGALPVLSASGQVTGILTDRDVCIALGTRNARATEIQASEVAHGEALVCRPEDDIQTALQIMRAARIRRLPVVNDGGLTGIVSIDDIVLHADSNAGAPVSYGDVVRTLQAIYNRGRDDQPMAA
jgi:CBS domain-containing protein